MLASNLTVCAKFDVIFKLLPNIFEHKVFRADMDSQKTLIPKFGVFIFNFK